MNICTCDAQLQPHDRLKNVCPPDAAQEALDWAKSFYQCDDCYRTDGTHDPEVEH